MSERRFPLPPVGPFARMLPWLVGALMPIAMAGIFAWLTPPEASAWFAIAASLLLLPLTGLAIAATVHGRTVLVEQGQLQVRRWPLPRRFALAAMDLDAARVTDIKSEPGLRPMVKLFGTRMPGLTSGWFLTRERKRAYVLSSTSERYAVLPLRDGRLLMLGVERPEALLAALRDDSAARR